LNFKNPKIWHLKHLQEKEKKIKVKIQTASKRFKILLMNCLGTLPSGCFSLHLLKKLIVDEMLKFYLPQQP